MEIIRDSFPKSLETLNIQGNEIKSLGVEYLARSLRVNQVG